MSPITQSKKDKKSKEDDDDYDSAYETLRDAYNEAIQDRGVSSDEFVTLLKKHGFESVDDIKDVSVMVKIKEEVEELGKQKFSMIREN